MYASFLNLPVEGRHSRALHLKLFTVPSVWTTFYGVINLALHTVTTYIPAFWGTNGLRACAKITWQIELITVRPEVSKGSGGHSCFDTSARTDPVKKL